MKFLSDAPALTFTFTAGSTDTGYDADNAGDDFPRHIWQGATAAADYLKTDVTTGQSVDAVFIGNTNAASVTVSRRDTSTGLTVYESVTPDVIGGNAWAEIEIDAGYQLRVDLTPPSGEKPYCGLIRAGAYESFSDPQQNLSQKLEDYSITEELNTGGLYYDKKEIVRKFSGRVITDADTGTGECPLLSLAREIGQTPTGILLIDEGYELPVFGRFDKMPGSAMFVPKKNRASFYLVEVV